MVCLDETGPKLSIPKKTPLNNPTAVVSTIRNSLLSLALNLAISTNMQLKFVFLTEITYKKAIVRLVERHARKIFAEKQVSCIWNRIIIEQDFAFFVKIGQFLAEFKNSPLSFSA
ncbi:hypothetical protein RF11_04738 [Thelohanellus kitauei]|uniref:Uncharacterized protein n=1 Tax=Thelohanellus kitauei TaxID=669202 RepID=A0A0C2IV51_THEKT|nr:hypothetical protein RF11_04738 [Thelohanellus kitauei]